MMDLISKISIKKGACLTFACMLLLVPLPWIAAALTAAVIHETGHILALNIFRCRIYEIQIGIHGAKIKTEEMNLIKKLLCTLAGPLASFSTIMLIRVFPEITICGFLQGIFNLLPIPPLDGGRAIQCLFSAIERKIPCKEVKQRVQ